MTTRIITPPGLTGISRRSLIKGAAAGAAAIGAGALFAPGGPRPERRQDRLPWLR